MHVIESGYTYECRTASELPLWAHGLWCSPGVLGAGRLPLLQSIKVAVWHHWLALDFLPGRRQQPSQAKPRFGGLSFLHYWDREKERQVDKCQHRQHGSKESHAAPDPQRGGAMGVRVRGSVRELADETMSSLGLMRSSHLIQFHRNPGECSASEGWESMCPLEFLLSLWVFEGRCLIGGNHWRASHEIKERAQLAACFSFRNLGKCLFKSVEKVSDKATYIWKEPWALGQILLLDRNHEDVLTL